MEEMMGPMEGGEDEMQEMMQEGGEDEIEEVQAAEEGEAEVEEENN